MTASLYARYAAKLVAETLRAEPPRPLVLTNEALSRVFARCVRSPFQVEHVFIRAALAEVALDVFTLDTDAGGTLTVRWEDPDGAPRLYCVDCGAGLVDDDRGPFYDAETDDGRPHFCPG